MYDNIIRDTLQQTQSVPTVMVPFELTNKNELINTLPRKINAGTYRLLTPYEMHIDSGRTRLIKTGIKLNVPQYVDVAPYKDVPEGVSVTTFPRTVLHIHISSIFDLLVNHGIEVIGPTVLTSEEVNNKELILYIKNIGKQKYVSHKGDEIAELHFTCSPLINLQLT